MTVFRFRAEHTNRVSWKNLGGRRLLTRPYFEYEIQFHNFDIKITIIVTLQPANQMPGSFPARPIS